MEPKRILITRTDRLGDVVLSTPVVRFIRDRYPHAYIAFMVRPETRDVISNNPHLDEVIIYDKYGLQKGFWSTVRFAFHIRKKRFDTAVALHPTTRTHIILFLAGIPRRIGYDRKMGWLLTEKVPHLKQEGAMHEAEYNFDLLRQCGFNTTGSDIRPYIETSENARRVIDALQRSERIGDNIIAVHSGASCRSKRWQADNFARVADLLREKYHSDIVLVGGDETAEYAKAVSANMKKKPVDLTGTLLVGELAELFRRCRLVITNDSGPMHVAVAVGTAVVGIFGRSDKGLSPKRWGPLGGKDAALHKNVGCEICLAHNCKMDFRCLKAVTPDEVIKAAENILTREEI